MPKTKTAPKSIAIRKKPKSLRPKAKEEPPDSRGQIFWVTTSPTGKRVDEFTILRVTVVVACLRFIASTLAGLDWNTYRLRPDGGKEYDREHPVDWLLDWASNPEMTAFSFRETQLANCCLWGNSYAEIERDLLRRPVALWPIHPQRACMERDGLGQLYYRIQNPSGQDTFLPPEDMFHIHWLSPDGLLGYNITRLASEALGLTIAAQDFAGANFGQAIPSGVLMTEQELGKENAERLQLSFQQAYGGRNSGKKVAVLEQGLEFKAINAPPQTAQMNESREFQVEEICRLYGVPLSEVTSLRTPTSANIEQQSRQRLMCLKPWADRLEREADIKLFGPKQRGNYLTKHDFKELQRGDTQSFGDFLSKMQDRGDLSVNEVRNELHLNSIGKDGDKRFFPLNFTTLDKAGEIDPATGKPGGASSGDSPGAGSDNSPKAKGQNGNAMDSRIWDGLSGVFADTARRVLRKEAGRLMQAQAKLTARPDQFPGWLASLAAEQLKYARQQAEIPANAAAACFTGELDCEQRVNRLQAALDCWAEDHAKDLMIRCETVFQGGQPIAGPDLWEASAGDVARTLAQRVRVALGDHG